jgi:hypothetical protein
VHIVQEDRPLFDDRIDFYQHQAQTILEDDLDVDIELNDIRHPTPIAENQTLSVSHAQVYAGERMECCGDNESIDFQKTELDSTFISC